MSEKHRHDGTLKLCLLSVFLTAVAAFSASDSGFASRFELRQKNHELYLDTIWGGNDESASHVFVPQDTLKPLSDGSPRAIVGSFRTLRDVDSFAIDRDSMIFFSTGRPKRGWSQSLKVPTPTIAMKRLDAVSREIPGGYYMSRNAVRGPDSRFIIYGKKEIFISHVRHSRGKHFKNHARLYMVVDFLKDYAWEMTDKQRDREIEVLEIE